ncbi:hypothetical protein BDSB_28730 [Burkholderia dolosa PC543]|nr:hypothetical protein BDSB_28730 [Burkholderia dolosa PC543]
MSDVNETAVASIAGPLARTARTAQISRYRTPRRSRHVAASL